MFYTGIDMLFSILFPILFLVVLGMILYTAGRFISTSGVPLLIMDRTGIPAPMVS